jgi:hypothetical protein
MMRLLLIIAIAIGYTVYHSGSTNVDSELITDTASQYVQQSLANGGEQVIRKAFENQSSNLQVEASGKVIKVLEDDTNPPRHQRFILELDNGISLLVAHNIDLAKRVADLKVGDTVIFSGEYEWNKKGGVLHWTHHDPQGRHAAGWLRHNSQTYQ